MANYLLVESRDPFEYRDVEYFTGVATDLAGAGNEVTLFLIQNAVLMSRKGVAGDPLASCLSSSKVEVKADEFSLRERGISADSVASGVQTSSVDELVDLLTQDGVKAVWH